MGGYIIGPSGFIFVKPRFSGVVVYEKPEYIENELHPRFVVCVVVIIVRSSGTRSECETHLL